MIIDVHCHVWPDSLAARMVAAKPAGLEPFGDGTVSGLLRSMDAAGIDVGCVLSIANEARHVARANEFAASVAGDRLFPFGTVHTGLSIDENLKSLSDNGIRAVKFHPNFQGISLGDPALVELFAALAEAGIVVLAHVGEGSDDAASERGAPRHVEDLLDAVPELVLIACHWGGFHRLEEATALLGRRVWLETSWPPNVGVLPPETLRSLIDRHGPDRIVFGSDWPMADQGRELAAVRGLGLEPDAEAKVVGGNLASLLGLAP